MFPAFHIRNHNIFLRMRVMMLIDRTAMMLLYRFNILNNIDKLRMEVVLVLRNWRIIDRLSRTIRTEFSLIHAAYITHVVIIISVHNNYLLPILEYTLLYSPGSHTTCTFDPQGVSLPC
jgi:hypothetical protein